MVSSPNRLFPLDLFHGRTPEQPWPRINLPTSRFLLSASDYRRLFQSAGGNFLRLLPVQGYWGFIRMKKTLKGRLLAFPVDTVFRLVSTPLLRFLRGSPINPWLVALFTRPGPLQVDPSSLELNSRGGRGSGAGGRGHTTEGVG